MQYRNDTCQGEEIRVGLCEHALDLVDFSSSSLFLGRVSKPDGHCRIQLELHERHGMESDPQRLVRDRRVNFCELRPKLPKFVWEDNGIKDCLGLSRIQCTRN